MENHFSLNDDNLNDIFIEMVDMGYTIVVEKIFLNEEGKRSKYIKSNIAYPTYEIELKDGERNEQNPLRWNGSIYYKEPSELRIINSCIRNLVSYVGSKYKVYYTFISGTLNIRLIGNFERSNDIVDIYHLVDEVYEFILNSEEINNILVESKCTINDLTNKTYSDYQIYFNIKSSASGNYKKEIYNMIDSKSPDWDHNGDDIYDFYPDAFDKIENLLKEKYKDHIEIERYNESKELIIDDTLRDDGDKKKPRKILGFKNHSNNKYHVDFYTMSQFNITIK